MAIWGAYVSNELDKVEGKNAKAKERAQARKLEALLSRNDPEEKRKAAARRAFADPAELFSKK